MNENTKSLMDTAAAVMLAGWWVDALPAIATALTIVWTVLRIAEMESVKRGWWKLRGRRDDGDEG